MTVDWEFLRGISVWQVVLAVIAISIIVKFLKGLWPGLRNTIDFIDDIGKLSAFMDETKSKLDEVHHEVHYNNGTSIKDAVKRVENGVAGLYNETNEIQEKVDSHIAHSVEWKSRLSAIDERTQPSSPFKKGNNDE